MTKHRLRHIWWASNILVALLATAFVLFGVWCVYVELSNSPAGMLFTGMPAALGIANIGLVCIVIGAVLVVHIVATTKLILK